MYAPHLRVWLAAGGVLLAYSGGCTQTKELSSPGAMPAREVAAGDPRINASTYFAHGHLLERQGNFERAAEQYRDSLELMPDFVAARNRLGITLNKLGRHAEATAEFRRAIAIQPGAAYLHNNLGFSLYLEGKYSAAEAATRRALEIKPSFPRARMNRALALARLERFDQAFDELCHVGSEADAYYNMAMLQTEAGYYADAARSLDMALRLNPRLEVARQQLREIAVLAARQEAVEVADVAADPDADQPAEPQPTADAPSGDVLAEAEVAILSAEATETESPETTDPSHESDAAELLEEPELAALPADAEANEIPTEAETLELAPGAEVAEPAPLVDLGEFFPEPEPPGWFGEPEPTEASAEEDAFDEPLAADTPESDIEALDDLTLEYEQNAPVTWVAPVDRPFDAESAIEMLNELITAIVDRSEELAAELWCELETYFEAAKQQNEPQPTQPPEPVDFPD